MYWIFWVLIGIIGFNIVFFGLLYILALIDEWREKKHREQY